MELVELHLVDAQHDTNGLFQRERLLALESCHLYAYAAEGVDLAQGELLDILFRVRLQHTFCPYCPAVVLGREVCIVEIIV